MTWLRPVEGGVELDLFVTPRAGRTEVVGVHDGRLRVRVAAPPAEGAANAALVHFLAKLAGLPRRRVEVLRGQASRRKTVRLWGADGEALRGRLGRAGLSAAATVVWLAVAAGCEPLTVEVDVRLVLPADTTDLGRVDNVSVVVTPNGSTTTVPVSGLDFSLEVAMDPADRSQAVEVYLAEGPTLLAWGRSPTVHLASTPQVSVFTGPPGALAGLAAAPTLSGTAPRVAQAPGFGPVVVDDGGITWVLPQITYDPLPAARAPVDPAEDPDLHLVGDGLGGVVALRLSSSPLLVRYDPAADAWIEPPVSGLSLLADRAAAATLRTDDATTLFVFGGGEHTDVVAVDLLPGASGLAATPVEGVTLPDPRRGAAASWARGPQPGDDVAVLVGTDAPTPVVWVQGVGAVGPQGPWATPACASLDLAPPAVGGRARILCAGGRRNGAPTADALVVEFSESGAPTVTEHPALLPAPMGAPLVLADASRLTFHGAGLAVPVSRADLAVGAPQTGLSRQEGGVSATLGTGAAVVVGGVTEDGAPVPTWEVFTPRPADAGSPTDPGAAAPAVGAGPAPPHAD